MEPPVLVMGIGGGERAGLLRYGYSMLDGDQPILILARTAEAAPAGVGGQAIFHRLFIAITFTYPFHLRFTPIVDGKVPQNEYADIEVTEADYADPDSGLVHGERSTHFFEITLSMPYIRDGVERFRRPLKGSYFQVEVAQVVPMVDPGELILENLELEYEVTTKGTVQ